MALPVLFCKHILISLSGDLSSSEAVMEFLASDDALDLPDRIEEVNAKRLDAQINEKTFIAVLFREFHSIL